MSLPVVASTSSNSSAAASVVVTAPTGIAIGDLLIGSYTSFRGAGAQTAILPTGFTQIRAGSTGSTRATVIAFFKVAVLADVSAPNYTFEATSATNMDAQMLRITGVAAGSEVTISESDILAGHASTTISQTGASTPAVGQSLAVMCVGGHSFSIAAVVTTSGYNSTPAVTWTERFDAGNRDALSDGASHAVATGPYTGTTQFTQYGYETSLVFHDVVSILFLINGPQSVTPNVSHLNIVPTLLGLAGANNVAVSVSHLPIIPTISGINTKVNNPVWTDQTKPPATWVSEIK